MIVAYIAHPIAGDVRGNIARINSIIADLARSAPNVLPFAPYLTALQVLDDSKPEERALGQLWNRELIERGTVDVLWLYGDRISYGMWAEIHCFAEKFPVWEDVAKYIVPQTEGTKRDFAEYARRVKAR